MHRTVRCVLALAALALASPILLRSQSIRPGSADLSGNVGFSNLNGVDNKTHILYGGAGAYNFTDRGSIGLEYSLQRMGSVTESGVTGTQNMQLLGANLRYSFYPSSRTVPYFLIGGGIGWLHAVASASGISVTGNQPASYFAVGGGASIFMSHSWGIRPEFRYQRLQFQNTTIGNDEILGFGQNDVLGTVALFYQFGGAHAK